MLVIQIFKILPLVNLKKRRHTHSHYLVKLDVNCWMADWQYFALCGKAFEEWIHDLLRARYSLLQVYYWVHKWNVHVCINRDGSTSKNTLDRLPQWSISFSTRTSNGPAATNAMQVRNTAASFALGVFGHSYSCHSQHRPAALLSPLFTLLPPGD